MNSDEKAQKEITRRDFFIGAAGAGAAVAGLSSFVRLETASASASTATVKYDKYFTKDVAKKKPMGRRSDRTGRGKGYHTGGFQDEPGDIDSEKALYVS